MRHAPRWPASGRPSSSSAACRSVASAAATRAIEEHGTGAGLAEAYCTLGYHVIANSRTIGDSSHPEILARLVPRPEDEAPVKARALVKAVEIASRGLGVGR